MTDEPLIVPPSPGAALTRLAYVEGVLKRHADIASALPQDAASQLRQAREALLEALNSGERETVAEALKTAQSRVRRLYENLCQPGLWEEDGQVEKVFSLFNFPDPLQPSVQAIDVSSVLATFSCPQRQIMTAIAFDEAPGALAYWLRETRPVQGEDVVDYLLERYSPLFLRVRLPIGPHRFQIESRDHSHVALSEEFVIVVPESV